ncbi:MAG: TldD/PmbA family protein [Patescibacteria group bacterium]
MNQTLCGEEKLKEIAQKVLGFSKADPSIGSGLRQTEVILSVGDHGLTRFANSQIHQNVAWVDLGVSVRVVVGKKIGVASANSFEEEDLKNVVARAEEVARHQKDDPSFISLPKPKPFKRIGVDVVSSTPGERAAAVSKIIEKAKKHKGVVASGAYSSVVTEIAIANSLGVWAYHVASAQDLSTILLGPSSTGFASQLEKTPALIDADLVADRALKKVLDGADPTDLELGEYEVILEAQAVGEMMSFLAYLGPNARVYHEKASFFSDKLGEKVLGENITLVDDPLDTEGFPMPFDFEGYPKSRLVVVGSGKLENLCYDSYYAGKHETCNTGHALPAPNTYGPIPLHLKLEPGTKSLEELVVGVKRGLLVTRLWYVRFLNPRSMTITGMTRDGTFLIEKGKIVKPVKNLRFNQSIPEALNNVVAIGKDLESLSSFETELGTNRMPALHIGKWEFTSGTEF